MVGFKASSKTLKLKEETKVPLVDEIKPAVAEESCMLAAGTRIEGSFLASENVRLDGGIKGEVRCARRLAVGEKGWVEGTLEAAELVVWGRVEGQVEVSGTLHIKSGGKVLGDIRASRLVVDEGGHYEGECLIGQRRSSDR